MSQVGDNSRYMNKIKERAIAKLQMSLINPDGVVSKIGKWSREDRDVKRYMTTKTGGPAWNNVVSRTTYDMLTGRIIEHLNIDRSVGAATLHRKLPPGVSCIRTVLHYKEKKGKVGSQHSTRRK